MPRAAIAVRETHPDCVLQVSTGPNRLLVSQLREGSLDLVAGRMSEADLMAGLSFRPLYQEEVAAVVRPGHAPLGGTGPRRLPELPLILPPRGRADLGRGRRAGGDARAGGARPRARGRRRQMFSEV